MNQCWAIVKKELLDAARDKKSLSTVFVLPVFFALFPFGLVYFVASVVDKADDIVLPVQGAEYALPLIQHLQENGVGISPAPEDPEAAILDRTHSMVLVIPEGFPDDFRNQRGTQISLLSDHARNQSQAQVGRVEQLINTWSQQIGALRLVARNVSPEVARPARINKVNVTPDERLNAQILGGLPGFILFMAFVSGLGMIAEMASGERERKSLEPLLANPVSHQTVFFGKWSAAVILTTVVALIGILLQFISINLAPTEELGLRLDMGPTKFFLIWFIVQPVIFFAVSVQLLVSFFAKSFKDAQSYNSLLMLLPLVPVYYLIFNAGAAETWQMFVPLLGPCALIADIFAGETPSLMHLLLSTAVSLVLAFLVARLAINLLQKEKTIFG